MKLASKIELSAGVGTVVLALISSGFFIIATKSSEVFQGSLHYVGLAMLVAIGSYFHVIRGRMAGLVLLLLSGVILAVMGVLAAAFSYARGLWVGVPVVLPCVSAALTVIAALPSTKARHISR